MPPPSAKALFLTPESPGLGLGGGALRSQSLLEYLLPRYEVDVVSFKLRPHSKALPARMARNATRLMRGVPPLFDRYSGYEAQLPTRHYQLAVVEHFWCASYATALRPRCDRLVLDLHNIESELARSHAQAARGAERWAQFRFADMYARLEREWLPRFDTLLVTSDADRARLQHPDIRVFPNAIPLTPVPMVPEEAVLVFSGNLEYHPNIEAVRWFTREVWPRLDLPQLRLVGRNADAIMPLLEGVRNVSTTGPVDDAIAAIAAAKVVIVPLRSGSGTRFKILEAWAAGRAVVSTTIGAEGLAARHEEHLLLADTPAAFAEAIRRVWDDAPLRQRLGAAGRALYQQQYTWPAAWQTLGDL